MRNMEWFSMNGVIRGMAINWSQGNEEEERESGYKKWSRDDGNEGREVRERRKPKGVEEEGRD